MWHFSLAALKNFSLYLDFNNLIIIVFSEYIFHQIGNIFSHYFFKYFFFTNLFFWSSGTSVTHILDLLIFAYCFLHFVIFFFSNVPLCPSDWIIFIDLTLDSLTLYSVFSILLLNSSNVFLTLVYLFFRSKLLFWLFLIISIFSCGHYYHSVYSNCIYHYFIKHSDNSCYKVLV